MANVRLSNEVADVLKGATVNGNNIHLPQRKLDRPLYEAVDKALTNMGGKWNKSARAHVFPSDPTAKLKAALGTGVAVDEKKLYQTFYTPFDLATNLAAMAGVDNCDVLEPSAGRGAIANACARSHAHSLQCVEMNPDNAAFLRSEGYAVIEADFLTLTPEPRFDRVVMNPPFMGNQDVRHVEHALRWLRPGGILVAVMFGNQERSVFQRFIEPLDYEIEELPNGTFKESGTDIATLILTVYV